MSFRNKVVVTGIGVVAPNGIGKDQFWLSLLEGKSGIGHITLFDASAYKSKIAGEVKDFDILDHFTPATRVKQLARQTQLALVAAVEAVSDANLKGHVAASEGSIPLFLGVSTSAFEVIEKGMERLRTRGPSRIPAHSVSGSHPQQAASVVAAELGFITEAHTLSSACASGLEAVAQAAALIREGKADIAIAGGTDSPLSPLAFAFLDRDGLASARNEEPERASRPFDSDSDTGVISEGAGFIVLENLEHALGRNVTKYLEIGGYGTQIDPDIRRPASGLPDAIRMALANSGQRPEDIDFICAHGPGNPALDRAETDAIKHVFGQHAYSVPISSIKGGIGNPLAAAGPMQLVSCACAFREGSLPPTANLENPAQGCDLDYIVGRPRLQPIQCAVVNSHGLGGCNGCIVVRRVDE